MSGATRRAASAGAKVFGALVAWNVGNYAFFLLAGRLLGVDDYGLLAALLAVTVVASVPLGALQMEIARQVAGAGAEEIGSTVYARALIRAAWLGPLAAVLAAMVTVGVATAVETPVVGLALTFAAIAPMPALFLGLGQLQGEHRFGAFSVGFATWGGARPILLLPLVAVGLGITAGLWATFGAVLLAALIAIWPTRERLARRRPPAPAAWGAFRRGTPVVAFGLAGIAVLTNVDVIAAQVWLTPTEAGWFAAVAVLAKAVILVPQATSTVLLPRIAAREAEAMPAGELLAIGVILALAAGLVGVLVGLTVSEPILRLTFGEDFTGDAPLLAPFAFASGLLGALIVLVNHHVGRRSLRFAWAMGGLALAYLLALGILHDSAEQIVAVNIAAGVVGLVMHEALFARDDESLARGLVLLARTRPLVRRASGPS